jgi:hypothetical protein
MFVLPFREAGIDEFDLRPLEKALEPAVSKRGRDAIVSAARQQDMVRDKPSQHKKAALIMTSAAQNGRQTSSRIIISVAACVMLIVIAVVLYMMQRSNSQRASAELALLSLEAATSAALAENQEEGEWLSNCLKATMSGRRVCDPTEMSDRFNVWQARLPTLSASALPANFCSRVANATAQANADARDKSEVLQKICNQ